MVDFKQIWRSFSKDEKRNIGIYILGIMFYKLGLEFFNGSITTLATDRFKAANTFTKLGAAQGVNQAMQCVGAILIAPLVRLFPTRTVLATAVAAFAVMTTILLITDAATGGEFKSNGKVHYGSWNANAIFPVWGLAGIAYGMVELIRRVIPADIVGGNVGKLRRMDATVHVWYEVAGTIGAFSSSSAISRFGNNYSFFLTPVFFTLAAVTWLFISTLSFKKGRVTDHAAGDEVALAAVEKRGQSKNYFVQVFWATILFFKSMWVGGLLIFGHRRFIWLFPAYSLALYLHRFLESSLAPAFARRVLGTSAWSQIIVGGSNFGELLGAASVFLLSDHVTTPLPWLRLDAIMLNIVWVMPHLSTIATRDVSWAWKLAGIFIPVSFGWAAGDVSLAAYIQASLSKMDLPDQGVSPLGAVMAFLYSGYVTLNAILSSLLGKAIDKDFVKNKNIHEALIKVAGIQFSVCSGIILLATLIPLGAFAINPKIIGGTNIGTGRLGDEDEKTSEDHDNVLKKHESTDDEKGVVGNVN